MKPARKMKMPTRPKKPREALLERKLYHLSQLVAALLYDKSDDPERGWDFAEKDVLEIDPKDLICELRPDPDLKGERRIHIRIKPLGELTESLVSPTT